MNAPCACVELYAFLGWPPAGRHVVVVGCELLFHFDRSRSLSDVAEPAILRVAGKFCSGPLEMLSAHFCAQAIPAGRRQPDQQ